MEQISSSIVGSLCEKVLDAVLNEYRLGRDVKEEIGKLAAVVPAIRDVLQDAEGKQAENTAARAWLKDLKQLLLDAEDVLDENATNEALRRRDMQEDEEGTRSVTWRAAKKLKTTLSSLFIVGGTSSSRDIAHEIEDINTRFDHIARWKNDLGLVQLMPVETGSSTAIRLKWRETSSVLRSDAQIIGRGEDMSTMRNLLLEATCNDERSVHVICVVGMGGIGKTTLVRHIFNDTEVTNHFQLTKWVCVSNDFDIMRITGEIVGEKEGTSLEAVLVGLRKKIQEKRFLLVLDDVWEEHPSRWDNLYDPLSYGAKGSKIVVTTRSRAVSDATKGTQFILKDLSNNDLWTILQKYAFDGIHDLDKNMQLVSVGRQIVEKLKGSPLAAKTIGRLLNSKMEMKHWTDIMKSDALSALSKGDIDSILPALKLSYDHLPGHLKQCFAYCSLFPEDHKFRKDELVRLWMAQQFIGEGSHVETVGGQCFDHLVHGSLFEESASDDDVHVMHDLIHDLADAVSKDDCLRLMNDDHPTTVNSETVRNISIINRSLDPERLLRDLTGNYKKLRTLLFLKGSQSPLSRDHLDTLFTNLPRLRVLDLSFCNIKELPESIGNLKHLRNLDLFHNWIKKLPESLSRLHNLQVLNLRDCARGLQLPRNMCALINLRHLLTVHSDVASGIRGLGKLTALHELRLDCGGCDGRPILMELEGMAMLRQLRIDSLEEVKTKEEAKAARLQQKEHLVELILRWKKYRDDPHLMKPGLEGEVLECLRPTSSISRLTIENHRGIRSPSWMEDPSWVCHSNSLETLEIYDCRDWEVLPPLGRLPCLKTLKIKIMNHVSRLPAGDDQYWMGGRPAQGTAAFFQSLEELVFEDMEELEEWEVPPPLKSSLFLPRLQKLILLNCPKLRQLPPLPLSLKILQLEKVGLTDWSPLPSSVQELILRDNDNLHADSLSAWLRNLTSLRRLTIAECSNVSSLPSSDALSLVTMALQTLNIGRLKGLKSLGAFSHSLNSLERLAIDDCPELTNFTASESSSDSRCPVGGAVVSTRLKDLTMERSSPQQLKTWLLQCPSLQELRIKDCPQLTGFGGDDGGDEGAELEAALLNLSPTLREFSFNRCENLRSLPRKLKDLSSLEFLDIVSCPEIRRLPESGLPESLGSLFISGCHEELEERCEEGEGSDWPLISHIPRREIW